MIPQNGFYSGRAIAPFAATCAVLSRGGIGHIGCLHSFKRELLRAMAGVDGTHGRSVPGHRGGSVWVRQDRGMASGSTHAPGR